MEKLIQVLYVSSAAAEVSEHETHRLVNDARRANREHDVSGMLLLIGGWFLQALEGKEAGVDAVCATIFQDKREMRMLLREPITERQFAEWTMGFEAIDRVEACRLLGDARLFDPAARAAPIDTAGALTLLSIIGRRRWQSDRSGMFRAIRRASQLAVTPS